MTTRLVRKAGGTGTEMVTNDGPEFPPGDEYRRDDAAERGKEAYVPGEVKAGDCEWTGSLLSGVCLGSNMMAVVLIHGNLLHKSEKK